MSGTAQFVVCVPATDGVAVAPCSTINGQATVPAVQEWPTLDPDTLAAVTAVAQPLDYGQMAEFYALPIAGTIGLYLAALCVASVVRVVGDA